jgi:hypothetical protein
MCRVECPAELVEMTQVKRKDDPSTFEIQEANREFIVANYTL